MIGFREASSDIRRFGITNFINIGNESLHIEVDGMTIFNLQEHLLNMLQKSLQMHYCAEAEGK